MLLLLLLLVMLMLLLLNCEQNELLSLENTGEATGLEIESIVTSHEL